MAGADLLWGGIFLYLFLQVEKVPTTTFLSAAFFVVFFAVALTYFARAAVFVDASGVTYRGMVHSKRLTFADIRKVDVMPGPVTLYEIRGHHTLFHFTSFFSHHRRLMELLVERAGLAPGRGWG